MLSQMVDSAPLNTESKREFNIDRSGNLFKYVNAYLVNGQLPRNDEGYITIDETTLTDLQAEAEFYGLQALFDDCKVRWKKSLGVDSFMTMRKYLQKVKNYSSGSIEFQRNSNLDCILRSFSSPSCVTGTADSFCVCKHPIYKNTSETSVNVDELIAAATQSPFDRGMETVTNKNSRNIFEIEASQLDPWALKEISRRYYRGLKDLAPHLDLTLHP